MGGSACARLASVKGLIGISHALLEYNFITNLSSGFRSELVAAATVVEDGSRVF